MLDSVFVSSTIKDLKAERNCVAHAINNLGYKPVLSECLQTQPHSSEKVCRNWARDCDVYILILGGKYGTIIPQYGISPTELEFREARASDPEKILVYVKDVKDREPRQTEFVSSVEDFISGYFRGNPFQTLEELEKRVKADLVRLMARKRAQDGYPLFLSKMIIDTSALQCLLQYYNHLSEKERSTVEILYLNPGITEKEVTANGKISREHAFKIIYPLVKMDMLFAEGQENIFFCIPADRKAYWDVLFDTISHFASAGKKVDTISSREIYQTYQHLIEKHS